MLKAMPLALLFVISCKGVPDNVIGPEDMSQIMADIHMAESVVEMNGAKYATDSARMALKQSIVMRRGYTMAQLDTSFMWYGAHLKEYDKVYDRTLEILEERLTQVNAVSTGGATVAVAGDSVDVWSASRGFAIGNNSASTITNFILTSDANWKSGDAYTWRAKFANNQLPANWSIVVDYTDGTIEYLNAQFSGDGWKELTFFVDSTRVARRISGTLYLEPSKTSSVYVDSMQLVRNRLNPKLYQQRYRQRTYRLD